jgi:hypothetical protein
VARKKRPHVATPDEVRITRDGDFAIIAYNDATIETTQYRVGADTLSRMTDEDILALWNAGLATSMDAVASARPLVGEARSRRDMSGLISSTGTLSCKVECYANAPNAPFIRVNDRMYTPMELAHLLGSKTGWEFVIAFVEPADRGDATPLAEGEAERSD